MNIDIDKIKINKLKYDNSFKKIICNINYSNKDIIIKLENVKIVEIKKDYIIIKNNSDIQFIFNNINKVYSSSYLKRKREKENLLDIDIENENIKLDIINNEHFEIQEGKEIYDLLIFLSHLEFVNKNIINFKLFAIKIL